MRESGGERVVTARFAQDAKDAKMEKETGGIFLCRVTAKERLPWPNPLPGFGQQEPLRTLRLV